MMTERIGHKVINPEGFLPFSALVPGDLLVVSAENDTGVRQFSLTVVGVTSKLRTVFVFNHIDPNREYYFMDQERNFFVPRNGVELISGFSTHHPDSDGVVYLPKDADYSGLRVGLNNWLLKPDRSWLIAKSVNALSVQKTPTFGEES